MPRILSAFGGIFFVILAIGIDDVREGNTGMDSSLPHDQVKSQTSSKIRFMIFDQLERQHLAAGQAEQALIRIDGNPVGMLTVNEHFPRSELIVTANAGQHSFAIEATAVLRINNKLTEVNCYGTGMIDVEAEDRFLFQARSDGSGPCLTWLEKR